MNVHDPIAEPALAGLQPGLVLSERFRLLEIAGKGGMGVVWRAHDPMLQQDVALKFLPNLVVSDSAATNDLRREARRARDLAHPHICRVHDYGEDRDRRLAWISMEYLPGDNLARRLKAQPRGYFDPGEIVAWIAQLGEAMIYAHEKAGLVHRDLKPANLLLDARSDLKVTDFGISQSLTEAYTRLTPREARIPHSSGSGTPLYMSPQQARGERPRATDDLYSLGATIFELLTGRAPFYTGDLSFQREHVPAPRVVERRRELHQCEAPISDDWEICIQRLLAKLPEHRPQSVREVLETFGISVASSTCALPMPPRSPPTAQLPPTSATATRSPLPAIDANADTHVPVGYERKNLPPQPSATIRTAPFYKRHGALVGTAIAAMILFGFALGFWLNERGSGSTSRTLRVPQDHPSIQAAINAAKTGDTVRVAPGTYREFIRLRDGVALIGEDRARCILEPADSAPSIARADHIRNASISNFTFSGSSVKSVTLHTLGIALEETSNGRVAVRSIAPESAALKTLLPVGAQLVSLDGEPFAPWQNATALVARHLRPCSVNISFLDTGRTHQITAPSAPHIFAQDYPQGLVIHEAHLDVSHCDFRQLPGSALHILGPSAAGTISENTIAECRATGLAIHAGGGEIILRGNSVENCEGSGIEISHGSRCRVQGNSLRRNRLAGISVSRPGTAPHLTDNICEENRMAGILFHSGASGLARQNQLRRNEDDGIEITGAGTAPELIGNTATGNRKYGLTVSRDAKPKIATDNNWKGNAAGAIKR